MGVARVSWSEVDWGGGVESFEAWETRVSRDRGLSKDSESKDYQRTQRARTIKGASICMVLVQAPIDGKGNII